MNEIYDCFALILTLVQTNSLLYFYILSAAPFFVHNNIFICKPQDFTFPCDPDTPA